MTASKFIAECVAVKATLKVLREHNEELLAQAYEDELSNLELYAEYQCEDYNDDNSYDPELVYIFNPRREMLVWECGLRWVD